MLGPVFNREASVVPKRPKTYLMRGIYVLSLFVLVCTGYLVLDGSRSLATTSDAARFGGWMLTLFAPLQLLVLSSVAAVGAASSVAQEKDRRTLILLLLTRLTGFEVVVGKLTATLLSPLSMLLGALPLFLMLPLLGGVSPEQIAGVFAVTSATIVLSGTIGTVVALWREKTFQAIAMTLLLLLMLIGLGEGAVSTGILTETSALSVSPPRTLLAAASPMASLSGQTAIGVVTFVVVAIVTSVVVMVLGIARVRVWNPSRELRLRAPEMESSNELEDEVIVRDFGSAAVDSPANLTPSSWTVRAPERFGRTLFYGERFAPGRMVARSL